MIASLTFLLTCWVAGNPPREAMPEYLRGVNLEKIQASPKLFESLYAFSRDQNLEENGYSISVRLYLLESAFGKWEKPWYSTESSDGLLPGAILVVKADGQTVWVESQRPWFREEDRIGARIVHGEESILVIPNSNEGNCRNCCQSIVLSLRNESLLSLAGQCHVSDSDILLSTTDDVWERNWVLPLCHALAPDAEVILKVENGKLVRDETATAAFCKKEIARLTAEIKRLRKARTPDSDDSDALSAAMCAFLNWRLLDHGDRPLMELQRLFSAYGADSLRVHFSNDPCPVSNMLDEARKLLHRAPSSGVVPVDWVRVEAGSRPQ